LYQVFAAERARTKGEFIHNREDGVGSTKVKGGVRWNEGETYQSASPDLDHLERKPCVFSTTSMGGAKDTALGRVEREDARV
jgi:hypothetical protein